MILSLKFQFQIKIILFINMKNIAIVGEGVVGISTALAIRNAFPTAKLTLISDRPFAETCSFGPAGIFRNDYDAPRYRNWAAQTFQHWASLVRDYKPTETGVQLVSGYIQSDNRELLERQERAVAGIVYTFGWMSPREMAAIFGNPAKYAIHFTSYAAEGRLYVPWLRTELLRKGGVEFKQDKLESIQQLADDDRYSLVVNCGGLWGGKLAGDDDSVFPNRGVALEVIAPGQASNFIYHDLTTFCIPLVGNDRLILGTLRQDNRWDTEVTAGDRDDILQRIAKLNPGFKGLKVIGEWCGLRPVRPDGVRLEHKLIEGGSGKAIHVIHNYGHASNGFVLSWGCAQEVVELIKNKGIYKDSNE